MAGGCRVGGLGAPARAAAAGQVRGVAEAGHDRHLARTALLVIDMQNDFCHPAGWLASIGVDTGPACEPVAPLARLLPRLRRAGLPILWVNWGTRPDRLNISSLLRHVYDPAGLGHGLGDALPGTGHRVLQAGSWSAQVVDGLHQEPGDIRWTSTA